MASVTPVILSGGVGTRLWPLSRELFPKQFHALLSKQTLFQATVDRVKGNIFSEPLAICSNEHRFLVAGQLADQNITPTSIVLEPIGRNTAPAAVVAALLLVEDDPNGVMLMLPSDHHIRNQSGFVEAVQTGAKLAEAGMFVTFGIEITKPVTGYGYIHAGASVSGHVGGNHVQAFKEKPDEATARAYMNSGEHYWNSGIFLFPIAKFINEMTRLEPDLVESCYQAIADAKKDLDFLRLDEAAFSKCPSISIDYAFMEKTDKAVVVPVDIGWSDVGSWDALWETMDKDDEGNVVKGDVIAKDTHNSLLYTAGKKLIATIGMNDIVVVDTDDCVLVAPRDRSEDIRTLVDFLRMTGNRTEHLAHPRIFRPWGWYECVDVGNRFQVKHIQVDQGGRLSLQKHHHRAEHWVIVTGTAKITRGEETFLLHENESTFIPMGCTHRLENPGKVPLQLIEIQSGSYLGEDDIIRIDDVYGRDDS